MKALKKMLIPENRQTRELRTKFGKYHLKYKQLVKGYMYLLCPSFAHPPCDLYVYANGAILLAYHAKEQLQIEYPDSFYLGYMSADAASMCANIYALKYLTLSNQAEALLGRWATYYHSLNEIVKAHPERTSIEYCTD